ncbi:PAS domain S-box protein [Pedobacter helvus]|uniref:histidine kinase n=1 Tax=Pedobacter helvus TaxID=2563444 RepID=A0ABW9JLB9_9SPHI|nr:PAS domain-containing hybrid sensor histidine kinase/response regulator [Pedobacter ureilyticus]
MEIHKLLQRQIKKHLTVEQLNNQDFEAFINSVNESYYSFERDKDLLEHAFTVSEEEYHQINSDLKKEYALKQKSISNLYTSIEELDSNYNVIGDNEKEDLLYVTNYIGKQINERKNIEKKLHQTVELLKALLEHLRSGILVVDNYGKILFINQYFCEMRKIGLTPQKLVGSDHSRIFHESKVLFKNQDQYLERVDAIVKENTLVIGELLETVDNCFFERDYIPIFIEEEAIGHLWKFRDVTEKTQYQNLLKQSEEFNRIIMNSSFNAIITVDAHGKITFWNKQAETIFGWNREEVIGETLIKKIIPSNDLGAYMKSMEHYVKTVTEDNLSAQLEIETVNKFGVRFPVELSVVPLEQNGERFFCSFIRDISERKENETRLRFQEEKYRNIIANMNLGLLEVDINETVQFANNSFASMSGYEISELIGKRPADLFVFGENIKAIEEKMALRKKGLSDVYQIPIKNKRGELRWWAIGGAPNYDDNGNLTGSIGIHLDITAQKELELELQSQKLKALEASKAKEVFLANMSHEMRTPLNAIIGFIRELNREPLTEKQNSCVENCKIASKHLLDIINNILDISKIEAGEIALENKDFILKDSLDKVIRVMKPIAKQKGLRLSFFMDEKIQPVVIGDALRVEQVLFNLIGNALKFTQKGKIILSCKLEEETPSGQKLHLTISDTGVGMDQAFTKKIFSKFTQEDRAVTRKFGGTGLGMAITKELVNLMNGEIDVESTRDVGTTIHIRVLFPKGNIINAVKEDREINVDINGVRILLVEDNPINRLVAINSLNYFNAVVTEACDGNEALEILKNPEFDIVLMDVQMPGMDGIEATKKIRNQLKLNIPIIAVTANAFKSEIDKCKEAGMNDYVTKPFEESVLIETIAKYTLNNFSGEKSHFFNTVDHPSEKGYDLTNIKILSRGNEDFVKKMIRIFITQMTETLQKIDMAFEAGNLPEVSRLIHKVKPSIESVGITAIIDDVKTLELIAKENNNTPLDCEHLYANIKKHLLPIIKELKQELGME